MVTSCGKTRYPSSGHADWALQLIRKRGARIEKKPTRSYLCPRCKGWHLTSDPEPR